MTDIAMRCPMSKTLKCSSQEGDRIEIGMQGPWPVVWEQSVARTHARPAGVTMQVRVVRASVEAGDGSQWWRPSSAEAARI